MTDPLTALRGDIEQMRFDPWTRAAVHGARVDAIEQRQEAERREAMREAREARMVMDEAIARQQIATRGYSDAELARVQAEREGARLARISELEEELDRIDPRRRKVREEETRRGRQLAEMNRTLAQAEAIRSDPFMKQEIMRFHERGAARESAARRRQIAELERREIVR